MRCKPKRHSSTGGRLGLLSLFFDVLPITLRPRLPTFRLQASADLSKHGVQTVEARASYRTRTDTKTLEGSYATITPMTHFSLDRKPRQIRLATIVAHSLDKGLTTISYQRFWQSQDTDDKPKLDSPTTSSNESP